MSEQVLPLPSTEQHILLSGETFEKVADCLIEVLRREDKRSTTPSRWKETIIGIGLECPAFASRLLTEIESEEQQIEALTASAMQGLLILSRAMAAAKAAGRYALFPSRDGMEFVRKDGPAADATKARSLVFPLTAEGLHEALEWLQLPIEEAGL